MTVKEAARESEATISDYVMVGTIPPEQRVQGRSYRDHRDFLRVAKHFPGTRGNNTAIVALAVEWLKKPEPKPTPNDPFTTTLKVAGEQGNRTLLTIVADRHSGFEARQSILVSS